ncbi:DUF7548 family protein [Halonotius pteroides]|uniref:Uncharacterized protein n=1 Tax=Halonotius pteroides TaxID=268735 RepID=A0A3A6QEV5_9EURY|nr:hypothetical protein [Halonotius pteroides]RJX51932.1 hypothetical protein DP106_01070 [Halonotius pteroides]
MEPDRTLPYLGAVASLVFTVVAAAPYVLVTGQTELLGAYYAAGPFGLTGGIFLAILGVVIFLSGVRGQADPTLVAGIMLAVGLAIFGLTAAWTLLVPSEVIYSFPTQYDWLEFHPWAALVASGLIGGAAAGYAFVVN